LPVPVQKRLLLLPASKKAEILWLQSTHPDLLARALEIESNAAAGLRSVKGLAGRSPGAGSWPTPSICPSSVTATSG